MFNWGPPFKPHRVCFLSAPSRPMLPRIAWRNDVLRSVAGIVGGCFAVLALSAMANAVVLHGGPAPALPPFPLAAMLLLMHGLAGIAGGYLAGLLAGRRPKAHGLAVGLLYLLAVQLASSRVRAVAHPVAGQPLWFTATLLVVMVVGTTLGGAARGQVDGR
jgi:hypothetical protein